jgi:hypothetical protein
MFVQLPHRAPLNGAQAADKACRVILNKPDSLTDPLRLVSVYIPNTTGHIKIKYNLIKYIDYFNRYAPCKS